MRDIDFRAKDLNGNWVHGYYEVIPSSLGTTKYLIHKFADWDLNEEVEVQAATVGEYTGRGDNVTNRKIYEGDIVRQTWDTSNTKLYSVVFTDQSFKLKSKTGALSALTQYLQLEVIGNVYDNANLLV